ncbi:MAG: hypothetical protein JSW62_03580 [Thermoplasmatales archaeon]|nr:MAG: hypothetical protein JSW62_03580 [Thermoplasmatales archaeon]
MKQKRDIFFYISLSIIAAILVLVLVYFDASKTNRIDLYDRLIVGVIVIIGCLFGTSLAFYPGWYKKISKPGKKNLNKKDEKITIRKRRGHHPDCYEFKNHVVKFNSKFFCTGCLGLAIGAISSIILLLIFLVITIEKSLMVLYLLIFLGLIMIAFNFVEIMLPDRHKIIHIFSNIFIMIGFLLIVIGVFEITGSLIYAIISILFSFLWLYTRIQLSNLRHTIICSKCKEKCKMY